MLNTLILYFHRLLHHTPAGASTTYWPLSVGRTHQRITQWVWRWPGRCYAGWHVTRPVTGANESVAKHRHLNEFQSNELYTWIWKYVHIYATQGYLFYAYFLLFSSYCKLWKTENLKSIHFHTLTRLAMSESKSFFLFASVILLKNKIKSMLSWWG